MRFGPPSGSAFPGAFAADVWSGRFDAGKLMVDQSTPASTRVRAAEGIINQGAKAIEISD